MCDPEMTERQARDGLLANMVDYDPCCGKTAIELILMYCAMGRIKKHVAIYHPLVDVHTAEPLLSDSQEASIVPTSYNPLYNKVNNEQTGYIDGPAGK